MVLSIWVCKLKFDEEKSEHAGLAQQNRFGPIILHGLWRLVKDTAKLNTVLEKRLNDILIQDEECSKYDLIAPAWHVVDWKYIQVTRVWRHSFVVSISFLISVVFSIYYLLSSHASECSPFPLVIDIFHHAYHFAHWFKWSSPFEWICKDKWCYVSYFWVHCFPGQVSCGFIKQSHFNLALWFPKMNLHLHEHCHFLITR
jgi:hypothetical protein